MNADDLPTTFAHKPVWPVAKAREVQHYFHAACGCMVKIPRDTPRAHFAKFRREAIAAAESVLLDAMGHQTFSSFVCVTFDVDGDVVRIKAWKVGAMGCSAA